MATTTAASTTTPAAEWFASWFDSHYYHQLYARRDDEEAGRFVDALIERLDPVPGATMLDLGCGAGRHARRLASRGFDVTGIDLSRASIEKARAVENRHLRFRRQDMRQPFGRSTFDYVFNMFTSFGYFERQDDHLVVLQNVADALKPGGTFALDYLNVPYIEAHLKPRETVVVDGATYHISRWSDHDHIFKRIVVEDPRAPRLLEHVERVAKFTVQDFSCMFALCGLRMEAVYGDYHLSAYDALESPRMVLVAKKAGATRPVDYLRERFLRMRLSVSGETPRYDANIH